MFTNETLKTHLETSATIQIESLVLAEWNMNLPDNIYKLGNYRYRPSGNNAQFLTLPTDFDRYDFGNYYTGATDADIIVDSGFADNDEPQFFTYTKNKNKLIYSLEDCTKPFRPRSGINKAAYISGKYFANSGSRLAERPRYYMPSRYDQFKYWTSYRTEEGIERGIANNPVNGINYIDDAVPFVVYKENVPANRIVIKMQTNTGTVDLGPFSTSTGPINDPLYGDTNRTTPARWKIQYLQNNTWVDAYSFTENDLRPDNTQIIKSDGYVELEYGLIIPDIYKDIFIFAEKLSSETLLPEESVTGYSYLVVENQGDRGTFHIWTGTEYETFSPEYGWKLGSETLDNQTNFITDLTSPDYFDNAVSGFTTYRDFQYIRGIRIVVESMNKIGRAHV